MNEPECKRCGIVMARGDIIAPGTQGPVFWRQEPDEQKRQELSQLSKKELKAMLKQGDNAFFDIVTVSITAYRCEECGSMEFVAREE
jgi:ribosomal protein S27AE